MDNIIKERGGIKIRKATKSDSYVASNIIYLTGENNYKFLFFPDEEKTIGLLKKLIENEAKEFSFKNAFMAEVNGNIAGGVFAAPGKEINSTGLSDALDLCRYMGFFKFIYRVPRFLSFLKLINKIPDDSYYISYLATINSYRRLGVATTLLAYCEEVAVEKKLKKLALDVETDRYSAIKLYEKAGFEKKGQTENKSLENKMGLKGFFRMEKELN